MARSRTKIAQLIGSLGIGGAEQQVVQLVNHLNPSFFERHVIVFRDKDNGFRYYLDQDVKYYSLQYRQRTAPIGMLKLIRYLQKNKIDVLHCHIYDSSKRGCLAGSVARVRAIVTTEHGKNLWKKWRHHLTEKHLINRAATKRVAVSHDIRILRIKHDGVRPENIITIPNGVIFPAYASNTKPKPRIVGSMGRLVEAKDYPSLLKALKMVRDRGYDVQLQIAGEGSEKVKLENLIRELGMLGNIKLLGFQKSEQFFQNIDVFAMSSIREGIPVALLEAMAHGIPASVTKAGGIPEVVEDGKDALLSKPCDIKEMAANLIRLIENDELRTRLGRNARQKVFDVYRIESIAQRYSELYLDLLNSHDK